MSDCEGLRQSVRGKASTPKCGTCTPALRRPSLHDPRKYVSVCSRPTRAMDRAKVSVHPSTEHRGAMRAYQRADEAAVGRCQRHRWEFSFHHLTGSLTGDPTTFVVSCRWLFGQFFESDRRTFIAVELWLSSCVGHWFRTRSRITFRHLKDTGHRKVL